MILLVYSVCDFPSMIVLVLCVLWFDIAFLSVSFYDRLSCFSISLV